jgi:hypothetical protein
VHLAVFRTIARLIPEWELSVSAAQGFDRLVTALETQLESRLTLGCRLWLVAGRDHVGTLLNQSLSGARSAVQGLSNGSAQPASESSAKASSSLEIRDLVPVTVASKRPNPTLQVKQIAFCGRNCEGAGMAKKHPKTRSGSALFLQLHCCGD